MCLAFFRHHIKDVLDVLDLRTRTIRIYHSVRVEADTYATWTLLVVVEL